MSVPLETSQEDDQTRAPSTKGFVDLTAPIWRAVLQLALPVLAQQFLILAVGLSDRYLAGHFNPIPPSVRAEGLGHRLVVLSRLGGDYCLPGLATSLAAETSWEIARQLNAPHAAYQSAQTTANYLAWLLSSYTVLVTVGSTALVARFIGAGDKRTAILVTHQSLLLAVLLGIVGTGLGFTGMEGVIWLLRLKGEAAKYALAYLRPLVALLVFQILESAGIACLVGAGDTVTGLVVTMGVAVINLPLAWGFCLGIAPFPQLGFPGIALGTAISHLLGCMVVLIALRRRRGGLELQLSYLRPHGDFLRRLLRISLPAGLDSLSLVAGQFWFLSIVNDIGDTASGAHGIAIGWEALGYLSGSAFGTAAMALVGQNLGANRPEQAAHSGWVAFYLGCGIMSLMGAVFFFLAPQMFALFCPDADQKPIIEAGVPVLRLVAFAMPALACCIVFTYALRGAGDTRIPVLFTWIGFLAVRIPLAYLLSREKLDLGIFGEIRGANLGLFGAWLAMFADLLVRGCFFFGRFAGGKWRKMVI